MGTDASDDGDFDGMSVDPVVAAFDARVPFYGGSQLVWLCGLKNACANDRAGQIVEYIEETSRFGIALHGQANPIAVKAKNIFAYWPKNSDRCACCQECFKLFAFPECSCVSNGQIVGGIPICNEVVDGVSGQRVRELSRHATTCRFLILSHQNLAPPRWFWKVPKSQTSLLHRRGDDQDFRASVSW